MAIIAVQRSYQFRIYPSAVQMILLAQYFGAARWVWNTALAWRSHCYKVLGERVSGVDFSRELTFLKTLAPFAWLKAVPATILTQTLRDQDQAFSNFFAKRARYPRFKKRQAGASIRFQLDQRCVMNTYRAGELLKLPGLGALMVRWSRVPGGAPKMVTLRRDPAGRYFVAFMVEETIEQAVPSQRSVGIDLGVKDVIITSDGQKSGNPRHLRRYRRRLKWAQRRLARKQKGSQRWQKQRQRVARLHARVHDARQDFLHKQTSALVQNNGLIAIEDLNVRGMSASAKGTAEAPGQRVKQKAGLNQSILDASFGELRRQLDYKCQWHGRVLLVADRWAPTSKTCSGCGAVQAEMPLQIRDWSCPACGAVHDRDVNAAMNVLRFATGGEPGGDARGGWTTPSAGVDGDTGVLAPEETRTKPKAVTKHPGRCPAAA
jgi:putative transposase